ncbi:MAG: glycoside hydrolase family 2 TIM barrel-domain containing protein [Saprospiraceae bacterium]
MKSYLPVFFVLLLFFSCNKPAQLIRPEGIYVAGVTDPMVKLNGIWEIDTKPEAEFWEQGNASGDWEEVQVPGEVMMQGFYIESNEPFAYRKAIDIPGDYAGKKIYLQFDGVYGYARLWVNGNFIREHHGGFTRWKGDITPHVKPGEQATIVLEVTDRTDDISYASGYAKHQIGGILRDVTLLALPQHHLDHFEVRTEMDETYENAVLTVSGTLISDHPNAKVSLELWDKKDGTVSMENGSTAIGADASFTIRNTIIHPEKWDAEHPNLYTLSIALHEDGELIWSKKEKIGFREVQVDGNRFLVNGQPVKLRGACRHDVHPELGRVSTPEYELQDVLLAKEANMNYIRTSHYPPSENFLKLCDEYGLYVEEETAVCFIINYRIPGYEEAAKSHSDPAYTSRYLSQLEEMVVDHRNHPSVVIWSIGNESTYGPNFQKSYDWIKENDPTRPVMLSYPGSTPDSLPQPYNILSMHYPPVSGDLTQFGLTTEAFGYEAMPVIFDEWAHVPCYNNATIKEDPNIRDFWGRSLDSMWIRTFAASGGLGGAIWGMIDETFMLPAELEGLGQTWGRTGKNDATIVGYEGPAVGYGEWGIIDTWRRKKPEFWNTKKAYSPIRIMQTQLTGYQAGDPIRIPVYNRFDHTNLSESKLPIPIKAIQTPCPV